MRKLLIVLAALTIALEASAQLYHPGEKLEYRVSYKAKLFPNTEVGSVVVKTTKDKFRDRDVLTVDAHGRTLPTYRWFFDLDDRYVIRIDPEKLRPIHFSADIKEGTYTFWSRYDYDWDNGVTRNEWQSRKRPVQKKEIPLTDESLDAISLFFRMRTVDPEVFKENKSGELQMVLQDTVRHIKYRFEAREVKRIRNMGRFRTLRFACQLGTSEDFTFKDGSEFKIWITDDRNKIPLYLESPVRIGSVQAYICDFEGLKYPVESRLK